MSRASIFSIPGILFAMILGSLSLPPVALAGEDFPFFCSATDNVYAFSVKGDHRSSTGYALTLFKRGKPQAVLPVTLGSTRDGYYWTVYAAQDRFGGLARREIFAFVSQSEQRSSHGEVRVSGALSQPDWELRPFRCRQQ